MAPEQARGETMFVGPLADVYSLGVILYECLTGTKPFQAPDQLALLRRVVEEEPERPGRRARDVPRDGELICLKCLAKDPVERYATAGALAADLERFAAGEPVSVRAAGLVERVARWARRKPTLAAAYTLGLLAVLLGGLGGAAVWQWRAAELARDRADTARGEAEQARGREAETRGEAERQREKFERFDYGRTIQVAHLACQRDRGGGYSLQLLSSTRVDLRGWEWHYVKSLTAFPADPRSRAGTARVWDSTNNVLVLALKGHTAARYDLRLMSGVHGTREIPAGGKNLIVVADLDQVLFFRIFDGYGRMVVDTDEKGLWEQARPIEALRKQLVRLWPPHKLTESQKSQVMDALTSIVGHISDAVHSATFSPDGSLVVTGSEDGMARVWDAKTGALVLALKGHTAAVHSATFSPDGSRVLTTSYDGTARIWDAKTGAGVVALEKYTGMDHSATFSPDGSQVFTGYGVWDPQTGHRLAAVGFGAQDWSATFFSLDGPLVILTGGNGPATVWHAVGHQVLMRLEGVNSASATFSPGGSRVVTGDSDGTARVWDAQSGALVLELRGHTGSVNSVTFSPDGSCLLTGSQDGTARVWYAGSFEEWPGPKLRLMSWGDGSPVAGADLVVVGTDSDNLLHIRAFDSNGERTDTFETRDSSGALHLKSVQTRYKFVQARQGMFTVLLSDALESSLPTTQSRAITTLKQQLPRLLPPHILSGAERGPVLSEVTLIIGHRP
jgi:WD40 repeat protein